MLVTRSNVSMQVRSQKRTLPVIRCVPPPSEDQGPDRKKLIEVRRLNQERVRNLTGILTSVKTYFDTEMELRKSLFQEILRISRLDLANIKDSKRMKSHEDNEDNEDNKERKDEHHEY